MGRDDDDTDADDAAAEAQRLRAYLAHLGATEDEAAEALAVGNVGGMALELALRGDRPATPFGEAADRRGLPFEDAARFWRALGFPTPRRPRRSSRPTPWRRCRWSSPPAASCWATMPPSRWPG